MAIYLRSDFFVGCQKGLLHLRARNFTASPTAGQHLSVPRNRSTFDCIDGIRGFYRRNSTADLFRSHCDHLSVQYTTQQAKRKDDFQIRR